MIYQIQTKFRDEARPARRHPARPRVRHEGLVLVRRRRRRARALLPAASRRLHHHLRPPRASTSSSSRRCRAPWAARPARSSSRPCESRRGLLRALRRTATTRPTSRPSSPRRPTPVDAAGVPAAHVEATPTPRPSRPWSTCRTHGPTSLAAIVRGRRRHPEERGLHGHRPGRHEVPAGDRPARRPRGRHEAARGRPAAQRGRPVRGGRLREEPDAGQGLHRPGHAGQGEPLGHQFLLDPRVVEGTRWITGANKPGHHVYDLVAGTRLHGRRHHRRRRGARGRHLPRLRQRPVAGARHRDRPHLPARAQVRRRPRAEGARREGRAGHGHDGLVRHRRLARRRGDRRAVARRQGPDLAARGRACRRPHRRHRQDRRAVRGGRGPGRPTRRPRRARASSTIVAACRPA